MTTQSPVVNQRPADEMEQPHPMRTRLPRLHCAFQRLSFRLVYLQMIKHDEYAGLAAEKHVDKQPIYAERGAIFDANNEVLAHNVPCETVVADATHINNRGALVPIARERAETRPRELNEKLRGDRRYIVLKRDRCRRRGDRVTRKTARAESARHLFRA
jgi:cell division protein FtsI/penicillin-binding protein 2